MLVRMLGSEDRSRPLHILPVIVIAQFFCTALWFAGNGVMSDLIQSFTLEDGALGHLTAAVQLGFIGGTLVFAMFTLADRFSPSRVFLLSAIAGALTNLGLAWSGNSFWSLILFRFLTGFFLAGIYPVGMKVASDWFREGLGKSLGLLVGALVLGTALPHLLKGSAGEWPWRMVVYLTSACALTGGLLMHFFVPDGPYHSRMQQPDLKAFFRIFHNRPLRAAAFGYFGHMWELYAFWAFVPVILSEYAQLHGHYGVSLPLWSFAIIAIGGPGCTLSGYLSLRFGARKVAGLALAASGLCCLLSPLIWMQSSLIVSMVFLLCWGVVVVADSPLFSTLVASHAIPEIRGTSLTIVNSIGFALTIPSIQLLNWLEIQVDPSLLLIALAPGPIFGLYHLFFGDASTPTRE